MLSTVACDRWADWSVSSLPDADAKKGAWTTISAEKEHDEHGTSIWIYCMLESGEKVALREICWVFGDDPAGWEVEVSAMAARPAKTAKADLEVAVRDVDVKWAAA